MSTGLAAPPRKLRIFAFDPSLGRRHETLPINEVTVSIPWEMERIDPGKPFLGPAGRYLEVIDYDPSLELFYAPVDLNDPRLLADGGLRPAEWDPQFHQQMTYAVAMNTIIQFERALGRVALWAPQDFRNVPGGDEEFVACLRIYPHALRDANAYYSPVKKALLFGYFPAGHGQRGAPEGSIVFTCLSHDIIAHETTHALLDGMHPRFNEASNPDVLALHEAFADIVAIFQHFSFDEVLKDQIARTRGNLEQQSLLGQLAQEFGQVLGRGRALRDALGESGEDGVWRPREPNPRALEEAEGPHARGAILVAAVFRAFLSIYRSRIVDLLRIASGGTGVLAEGELHPDLVNRLAREAAKSADHVLQMCIRGLDYVPPVNVTFGDYLRGIITADADLYADDEHNYRVAFLEAFLAWGIVPRNVKIMSVETMLWPMLEDVAADYNAVAPEVRMMIERLALMLQAPEEMIRQLRQRTDFDDHYGRDYLDGLKAKGQQIVAAMADAMADRLDPTPAARTEVATAGATQPARRRSRSQTLSQVLSRNLLQLGLDADRRVEWLARRLYGQLFWGMMTEPGTEGLRKVLRICTEISPKKQTVHKSRTLANGKPALEVHSVRMATRTNPRGVVEAEYVVELIQTRDGYFDADQQQSADEGGESGKAGFKFRWGCTLLINAETFQIRRVIQNPGSIEDDAELGRVRDFMLGRADREDDAFTDSITDPEDGETFARLHIHGM
ncbi:hypothetical protein IQ26_04603 [Mesorhizobium tianshanense]|uniref:Peptidase M4 n=1 Tax=Mesorhizobium tianshanense TaxID=39844 RepID=A0A562NGA2_9HYPH|nr:hypothetical protein IQ26_04603 [Mesorhizobium tianshanense]